MRRGVRVGDVKRVLLVDPQSDRAAELFPGGKLLAGLAEDQNPVVAAVGDKKPALIVEGQGMGSLELTVAAAFAAPGIDEFSGGREMHDAGDVTGGGVGRHAAVTIGHEDVAIGRDGDIAGLIQVIGAAAGLARRADHQQHLAVLIHLGDGLAFGAILAGQAIADIKVALLVDGESVRPDKQARADGLERLAGGKVEFIDRGDGRAVAGVGAAAADCPHIALGIHVDARGRTPGFAVQGLGPTILRHLERRRHARVRIDVLRQRGSTNQGDRKSEKCNFQFQKTLPDPLAPACGRMLIVVMLKSYHPRGAEAKTIGEKAVEPQVPGLRSCE